MIHFIKALPHTKMKRHVNYVLVFIPNIRLLKAFPVDQVVIFSPEILLTRLCECRCCWYMVQWTHYFPGSEQLKQ